MCKPLFLTLFLSAIALAKGGDTAKIFTDKGSTYFRTDDKKVLAVGTELDVVVDAKGQPVGKAVIMEVTGALARISLDDEATAAKAKLVVLPKAGAAHAEKTAEPAEAAPPVRTPGPKLEGRLELSGLRFAWNNDSDASWTACKLVHSDGSFYDVGEVVKHSEDTVMRIKLGGAPEPAYDHLEVVCAEGKAKFFFDKPSAPQGNLKGYATNDRGSVVIYNQNDTAWTACDVRKPNGTHYVLGPLKGHQDDSIDKGRFKKEEDNKPKWIEMRCNEGDLHAAL